MAKTAGVYRFSDLPTASQAEDPLSCPYCSAAGHRNNRHRWVISDLQAADQAEASGRDVVGIVDGAKVTVLSPTANLASSLKAIALERASKGI